MTNIVPEGWLKIELGKIGKFSTSSIDKKIKENEPTVSLLNYMDVYKNSVLTETYCFQQVTAPIKHRTSSSVQNGDVFFTPSSETPDDLGHSAVFLGKIDNLVHSYHTIRFRPKTNEYLNNAFKAYAFKSTETYEYFRKRATGSTRFTISLPIFNEIEVFLPPLQEQKKIAAILTSVDEVLENTQKQIDKLQDLKKATMNELLTKGIGHTEFKASKLGQIPKSWEARQVQEIAKIIRGASPRPKGDPRFYGETVPRLMVSDVTRDGKYVFPKTDFLTTEGAKLSRPMSKGGLTIVCSGTVGVPSILGVDACIHDGFLGLVDISNQCTNEFLYYAFLPLQGKFDSSATHGGVFTNLTTEILKEFTIGIPPLGEQLEIVRHISSLDEHLNAQINKLSQTQSLKKSLMQDLLTGKIRVAV